MAYAMVATWGFSLAGVVEGAQLLASGDSAGDASEAAVKAVEDDPAVECVGYGGLPDEMGAVTLDAAFMDGDTLSLGAVAGVKGLAHPVSVARRLSHEPSSNLLVGEGAERYAALQGFDARDMLSETAAAKWRARLAQEPRGADDHDTIGVISLDSRGSMAVAMSTSGLFLKRQGRVGDTPLVGCGFYCDSAIGAVAATGVGEDIMKGCLASRIVAYLEQGLEPQQAAERAVRELNTQLTSRRGAAGAISAVCMDRRGRVGAASNLTTFSYVVASGVALATVREAICVL